MKTRNMQAEVSIEPTFKQELALLINKHGIDSKLSIPDYILANHLGMSLSAIERTKIELLEHKIGEHDSKRTR